MDKQLTGLAGIEHYFKLFDWWQTAPLSAASGLAMDRIRYFVRLRRKWQKAQTGGPGQGHTTHKEVGLSEFSRSLRPDEARALEALLPAQICGEDFEFIDLFAGIGGLRLPFSRIGGRCILTCERDAHALNTYKANWQSAGFHRYVADVRSLTQPGTQGARQKRHIREQVPGHDLLLAGFPCQPFSIAGVSRKNSLNRAHGFECQDQGQLFFDIARILWVKQPPVLVLENVKNLKSHNSGSTFSVIQDVLTRLPEHHKLLFGTRSSTGPLCHSYWIADLNPAAGKDPKIIDARDFVPQHRERLVLICIRSDLAGIPGLKKALSLTKITRAKKRPELREVLDPNDLVDPKYTLSPALWGYLQNYARKHRLKGNGFGYGLISRDDEGVTRTLSARYYKDGSEILISQDDMKKDPLRRGRPRRLTPAECARLMGFSTSTCRFNIPVSDSRSYRQFGNSVVVPVFQAVAELLRPWIPKLKSRTRPGR